MDDAAILADLDEAVDALQDEANIEAAIAIGRRLDKACSGEQKGNVTVALAAQVATLVETFPIDVRSNMLLAFMRLVQRMVDY